MLKRRTLAFGKELPREIRNLFFSTLAATMAGGCSAPAYGLPQKTSKPPIVESIGCNPDLRGVLVPGEKILRSICREGLEFVLTDRHLITVSRMNESVQTEYGPMRVGKRYCKESMAEYHAIGIVDWTASGTMKYILTKDRSLTRIPIDENDETQACSLPLDVKGAQLQSHRGVLLMALGDRMVAFQFKKTCKADILPFVLKTNQRAFFESGSRLFFGNESDKIEIIMENEKVKLR